MNGALPFGRQLERWRRFSELRQDCPGCLGGGDLRKTHELCRQKIYERGSLVDCWRSTGSVTLPPSWHDFGNTGGQGCRRFFIPRDSNSVSTPVVPVRPASGARNSVTLPPTTLAAWCSFLRTVCVEHVAHLPAVAKFYADRHVPFDRHLYSVGPSRLEATRLIRERLIPFVAEHGLANAADLPGVVSSKYGAKAYFPAAKHGEAWEWSFSPDGRALTWSRRLLHPERERRSGAKSMAPSGGRHHLHHVPGWITCAQQSRVLVVTEGTRKANEVQRRTGLGALGLPSVSISTGPRAELIAAIESASPEYLYLAPDFADLVDGDPRHDPTRNQVLAWDWLVKFAEQRGASLRALTWEADRGKGIDDVLASLRWIARDGGA